VQGDRLVIDRQELRDELYTTSGFQGMTGETTCDRFGDCGVGKVAIFQHIDLADHAASRANIVYTFPED